MIRQRTMLSSVTDVIEGLKLKKNIMSIQHSMQRSHQFYLLYYVQDDSLPSFSNREVYEVQLLLLVYRYGTFIGLFVCRQDNWKSWMDKDHNFRVDKPPAKVGSTPPPTQEESH